LPNESGRSRGTGQNHRFRLTWFHFRRSGSRGAIQTQPDLSKEGSNCLSERDAVEFAAKTFNEVFVCHDEEFLRSNLNDEEHVITPHDFINQAREALGKPLIIGGITECIYDPSNRMAPHGFGTLPTPGRL
jgi:hypothetical protein